MHDGVDYNSNMKILQLLSEVNKLPSAIKELVCSKFGTMTLDTILAVVRNTQLFEILAKHSELLEDHNKPQVSGSFESCVYCPDLEMMAYNVNLDNLRDEIVNIRYFLVTIATETKELSLLLSPIEYRWFCEHTVDDTVLRLSGNKWIYVPEPRCLIHELGCFNYHQVDGMIGQYFDQ